MSETKPTAGALRAAKEILDTDHRPAARIIDREMASPLVEELLKSARTIANAIKCDPDMAAEFPRSLPRLEKSIRALESALGGKAE